MSTKIKSKGEEIIGMEGESGREVKDKKRGHKMRRDPY